MLLHLVFSNGAFDKEASDDPKAVALEKRDDTWHIAIPATEPLSIHLQTEGQANLSLSLTPNSRLFLMEESRNGPSTFVLTQASNSNLTHGRFLDGSAASTNLSLANDATYKAFFMLTGDKESSNEMLATLDGPNATLETSTLILAKTKAPLLSAITVTHNAPHTQSRQICKAVADNDGRASLLSKTIVAPNAQKVDAKQTNNALLLSDDAVVISKPELEIDADDVKCGHGSAIGNLDPAALFYLQSRGLPAEEARSTLIRAFIDDLITEIENPALRERAQEKTEGWFNA